MNAVEKETQTECSVNVVHIGSLYKNVTSIWKIVFIMCYCKFVQQMD